MPNITLKQDPKNANLGTARGTELLKESIESCGLGRSIVADKHGTIIGGNKTFAAASEMGIPTEVVQTTGAELVVVQRTDLDLSADSKARQLAYYDNRTQEVDLSWSPRQVHEDVLAGVDVESAFFPDELSALMSMDLQPLDAISEEANPGIPIEIPIETAAAADLTPKPSKSAPSSFMLTFNTVAQQLRWAAFMRLLREIYPDLTPAQRLSAHLSKEQSA